MENEKTGTGRSQSVFLPDRLSVVRRQQAPCGCITGVDKTSGYAVVERECPKAARR